MKCDVCGNTLAVIDTRNYNEIQATRRRRECVNGHRRTTIEIPVASDRMHTKTIARNLTSGIETMATHAQALRMLDEAVQVLRSVSHG